MTRPQSFAAVLLVAGSSFLLYSQLLYSQQPAKRPVVNPEYTPWETKVIAPVEVRPAKYLQVPQRELDAAAADGWELVSVAPFVLANEARGQARQDTVTQVYPAYYFKRVRRERF